MDKNQSPRRKSLFDMRDVKRLVFVLALASMLGFWALFSNKLNLSSFAAAPGSTADVSVPPTEAAELIVLELQPIPTLFPTPAPFTASPTTAPVPVQNPVSSAPAQTIILGSPPPTRSTRIAREPRSQNRANKPAPVTTTSSSQ